MENISKELDNLDKEEYSIDSIISKSIQNLNKLELIENKKVITLDGEIIESRKKLDNIIKETYIKEVFEENTKIHMKIKLNLREYLIITNYLFPTFIKYR